jgi:hypothetical protein
MRYLNPFPSSFWHAHCKLHAPMSASSTKRIKGMNDDFINGVFQALAAVMVLNNVRALHRDREVRGVSIASTVFFFVYGIWNLRYYPLLGQWWSFAGGVLVTLANCLCVGMMIYYTYFKFESRKTAHVIRSKPASYSEQCRSLISTEASK